MKGRKTTKINKTITTIPVIGHFNTSLESVLTAVRKTELLELQHPQTFLLHQSTDSGQITNPQKIHQSGQYAQPMRHQTV